jgi:rsbT co-antagonist protein RsbR
MKAADFNLSKEIEFNFKEGITLFRGNRLVLFDAGAIGLLRQKLRLEIGTEKTRNIFLALGYQNGFADCLQMKLNYQFDTEMDLLAAGPVIHTWEGIVQATPKEIRMDKAKGEFYFTGVWTNSYEAEQHLSFNPPDPEPVCWSLMGYASGYATCFWGSPLMAIEPVCVGKGDAHCEWLIQPPAKWGRQGEKYLAAYEQFYSQR